MGEHAADDEQAARERQRQQHDGVAQRQHKRQPGQVLSPHEPHRVQQLVHRRRAADDERLPLPVVVLEAEGVVDHELGNEPGQRDHEQEAEEQGALPLFSSRCLLLL